MSPSGLKSGESKRGCFFEEEGEDNEKK